MGREVGGMFKWEGTWVNLWLIHVDVWQKPMQYCKAIILELKINKFLKNIGNYDTIWPQNRSLKAKMCEL